MMIQKYLDVIFYLFITLEVLWDIKVHIYEIYLGLFTAFDPVCCITFSCYV